MSLDLMYNIVKSAKYPVNSRKDVLKIIGTYKISFNGHMYDARNISLQIEEYPIPSPAKFIESFIEGYEEYNPEEGRLLHNALEKAKT